MGGIVGRYMVVEVFFYVLTVFFDDMVSKVGGGRVFIAQDMVPDLFDIVFEFHVSFNWINLHDGLLNNAEAFTRIYPRAEFLHAFSVGSTDFVMGVVEVVPYVSMDFVDFRHGGILLTRSSYEAEGDSCGEFPFAVFHKREGGIEVETLD